MSLEFVIEAIKAKRCLPFLGAGASAGYSMEGREVPGIPLGGKLCEKIAAACGYPNGSTNDLARVAEYFVFRKSGRRDELENLIRTEIRNVTQPRPIHTTLAQLDKIHFVLTSNYDELLEMELIRYGRDLTKHFYDLQNPKTGHFKCSPFINSPSIILHKMHGTVESPRSMVITQSDYIRYLANLNDPDRGMPEFFRKTIIPNFHLLFLGYSLEDWNFRVIWEGVLANYRETAMDLKSYALLRNPSDFQREFWLERKVKLIDCELTDFARELAREFNLEVPQLGIVNKEPGAPGGAMP
jgi:SIR2-like domain